ncbi:MAG TPA: TetR/AcrR family transcriptional regulator [Cytophagaceae bacterium]|nr:TetR/AcrR family transcriptional regulator [Cytophagaceae bacterium]
MTEKRDQIKKAALKLFCENGFQNTSTANISKEADVATGTLFLYFPSKEGLINSLYVETKQEQMNYLQEGLSRQKTSKTKMRHLWIKANDWALKNQHSFRFTHMFASSPYVTNLTKKEVVSTADLAEKVVKTAIKEGSVSRISVPLFFSMFDSLSTASVNHCTTLKNKKDRQKAMEQAFEVFWKGVSK